MVWKREGFIMEKKTNILRSDILEMSMYENIRDEKRAEISKVKKNRRVAVGPHASFYFECFETMWYQIHEMIRVEKGGESQIQEEIAAYDPLVPKGTELVATVMFEIPDADKRARILAELGGVEETITLEVENETIQAIAEEDVDRTNSAGKASSVHFIHFPMNTRQINLFKDLNSKVVIAVGHPQYGHMTVIPKHIKEELSKDFL